MKRGTFVAFGVAASLAVALAAHSAAADDAGAPPAALPACISVGTDARYVPYGYNHIVILKSGCSKRAACTVATDVNPQPIAAEVAPGATVEVQTFNASPVQTFVAKVSCSLR